MSFFLYVVNKSGFQACFFCCISFFIGLNPSFAQKVIHLPYAVEPADSMQTLGKAQVHKQCYAVLVEMITEAKKEGVHIGIKSGYRDSISQVYEFYGKAKLKGQTLEERTKNTAPPGFSEHHTGFAIDFMDLTQPQLSTSIKFETTPTYKWIKTHAQQYGWVLSFPPNNAQNIQYEPWHWHYEGNAYAKSKFSHPSK